MDKTQKLILEEKEKRGLSNADINAFVQNQKVILNDKCARCQSVHKFEETERVLIHSDSGSYEQEISSWSCIVCGFNAHKYKALNFRMRIHKFFNKYYTSKIF